MAFSSPDVTVCITAYKSGRMIEPTLRSVKAQTHSALRVLVSIDGPHEETESICRVEADSRFEIIVQPERLGWVGNTNALLDRIATEYFFILPHDDLLGDRYVEMLRRELIANPAAVNAYSDVEVFGADRRVRMERSGLDGDFLARIGAFLNQSGTSWIPWRGLTRSSVLTSGLRMRDNRFGGYDSLTDYVLGLLCLGPCHRVPETLYFHRDRSDEDSVRTVFKKRWAAGDLYTAELQHALECMQTISSVGIAGEDDVRDRRIALQMILVELLDREVRLHKSVGTSTAERITMVAGDLLAALHSLPQVAGDPGYQPLNGKDLGKLASKMRVVETRDAISRKQFAIAKARVTSATELDPENAEAHWQSAIILRREGHLEEAISEVRKAQALFPWKPQFTLLHAKLLNRVGNPEARYRRSQGCTCIAPRLGGSL